MLNLGLAPRSCLEITVSSFSPKENKFSFFLFPLRAITLGSYQAVSSKVLFISQLPGRPWTFLLFLLKLPFLPMQGHQNETTTSYLSYHLVFIWGLWLIINPTLELKKFQHKKTIDLPKKASRIGNKISLNHTHTLPVISFTPTSLQVLAKASIPQVWQCGRSWWAGEPQVTLTENTGRRGEKERRLKWERKDLLSVPHGLEYQLTYIVWSSNKKRESLKTFEMIVNGMEGWLEVQFERTKRLDYFMTTH